MFAFVAAIGIALAAFYACACTSGRCTTACPTGAESREIGLRDGIVLAPLVACIVALALWPGLILERGEDSVTEKVDAVAAANESEPVAAAPAPGKGWTGYGPVVGEND